MKVHNVSRGLQKISPKVTLYYTDILNYGQFSQSGLHSRQTPQTFLQSDKKTPLTLVLSSAPSLASETLYLTALIVRA